MRREPLKILIVEDDATDAAAASKRISQAPSVLSGTTIAPSLDAALGMLERASYHMVILDLNLPDSRGLETLRRFRAAHPELPVVVVSGIVSDELRSEAIEGGASAVLSKAESERLGTMGTLFLVDRDRAEERGRELERLLEASPDALIVVGLDGQVRYVNEAAARLFGRDREELAEELLTFAAREGVPVELTIPRQGDPRVGEMRVVDFEWEGEPCLLASIRDVTEQKKLEMRLVLSERMASLGTLAAGIAHEINNPLTAVLANLEVAIGSVRSLGRRTELPEDLLEELGDALLAADRVREIVASLKLFSSPSDGHVHPVDVRSVVEATLRMARSEIRHRAQVVKEYGEVPLVQANDSKLGQVVLNLLVNAAQSIPEGNPDANEIRIRTGVDDGGCVTITVADTGSGIPREARGQLFTPFFTTRPGGPGAGLGLAICHRIVTSFGGEISFESVPGRGSLFCVALPAVREEPQLLRSEDPRPRRAGSRRGRVLVIDDEEVVLDAVERVLGDRHDVTVETSAARAMELVDQQPDYDVILCDLMMPQMTGMDVYRALKKHDRGEEERMVFMTAGAFTEKTRAFLQAVPNPRIDKPFSAPALLGLVGGLIKDSSASDA